MSEPDDERRLAAPSWRSAEPPERTPSADGEHRGWYEQWLDEVAGERVATGRLAATWFGVVATLGGLAALVGVPVEPAFTYAAMTTSLLR